MDLIINNALHDQTLERVNIGIKDGKIVRISSDPIGNAAVSLDADGAMISPAFIEPHFHLDNAVLPEFSNVSGTLDEAIKIAEEVKDQFSADDLKHRSSIALKQALLNGTLWLRNHCDVDEIARLSLLEPILAVRDEYAGVLDIQIVAFPQFGLADSPGSVDLMREAMEMGANLVGGVPHREKDMDKAARQIEIAFNIAQEYDADIDMHVDETDDPYWHTLELLAEKTIETDYQGRVTAGHCCAMAAWDEALYQRILPKILKAEINICSNTPVNLVLQGRTTGNPVRRGITRVKDLLEAGVNVTCGQDDLQNMFYPFGNMDMLSVANFVAHVAHLSSQKLIQDAFDMPRQRAARTLRLDNYGLVEGADADLVIFRAESAADALRRNPFREYVIRKGKILVETRQNVKLSPGLPFGNAA